jgi:hypothetical protein
VPSSGMTQSAAKRSTLIAPASPGWRRLRQGGTGRIGSNCARTIVDLFATELSPRLCLVRGLRSLHKGLLSDSHADPQSRAAQVPCQPINQ